MRDSQHGFRGGQPNRLPTASIPAPLPASITSDEMGLASILQERPGREHGRTAVCLPVRNRRLSPTHDTVSRGGTGIIWRWAHRAARLDCEPALG